MKYKIMNKKTIKDENFLEKCPFCGSDAEWKITHHCPNGFDYTPRCTVTSCPGRLTKKYTNKKQAQTLWNTRFIVIDNRINTQFV